jgi:hypothetical protein
MPEQNPEPDLENNQPSPEQPVDPVLRRRAIFRVLLLTLALLALPIGMLTWGLRDHFANSPKNLDSELPDEATASLRQALEHAADRQWEGLASITEASPQPSKPLLPVLEWPVAADSLEEIMALLYDFRLENPAKLILLQPGEPEGERSRFMISAEVWNAELRPTFIDKEFQAPQADSSLAPKDMIVLEIYSAPDAHLGKN